MLHLQALTLLSAVGCNLNCEYCHIARSVNDTVPELQVNTIKALQDGTYLKNILAVLNKLGQSPAQIETIAIWGQEPTLTIQYLTEHLDDWLKAFPNWHSLVFSTNSMDYADRILDLYQTMEKFERKFSFCLQCSYDGNEGTDTIRKANSQQIYNNLQLLILGLQRINFHYVDVSINFHGVVSLDLLHKLNTTQKIANYYLDLDNFAESLASQNYNSHVSINNFVDLTPETPLDASAEDGLLMADFVEKSLRLNHKPFPNSINSLLDQYSRELDDLQAFNCKSAQELLEKIANSDDKDFKEINEFFSRSLWCGNGSSELKIMYDGTCANCQNHIYETKPESIHQDGSIESATKKSLAEHHYFINPLTDPPEIIDKYLELFRESKEDAFLFNMTNVITIMCWLLQCNQIESSYNNLHKLLDHAWLLAWINACYYNHYITTGSMFIKSTGFIRFFCNGFLDYIFGER